RWRLNQSDSLHLPQLLRCCGSLKESRAAALTAVSCGCRISAVLRSNRREHIPALVGEAVPSASARLVPSHVTHVVERGSAFVEAPFLDARRLLPLCRRGAIFVK